MGKPKLMMFEKDGEDNIVLFAELFPAEDENDGYIGFSIDDKTSFIAHLDIDALGDMLLVLKGKHLSTDNLSGGWGEEDNAYIVLRREFSPASHFIFSMRNPANRQERTIKLTDAQAAGLCAAIEGAMVYVAFGIPKYY